MEFDSPILVGFSLSKALGIREPENGPDGSGTLITRISGGGVENLDGRMSGGNYNRVELIAQLFGVTVRRIQQLTQEGVLHTTETPEGRRYDLVPTIQAYVRYLSDKAYGKNRNEKEMELRQQKLEAEIALKESQGELHRLRTEIAAGKYIAIEEVTADYTRFFVTFKKFALALPARLADAVSGYLEPTEARRLEKDLQREVQRQLEAFVVAGVTEDVHGGKK